jgi:hypothetical protein
MAKQRSAEANHMKTIETHIADFALKIHYAALSTAPSDHGLFKGVFSFDFEGRTVPLLLVGNAHPHFEDGHCIAILNPSLEVVTQISPGVTYGPTIKKIVSGQCEVMLDMFFEHYKKEKIIVNEKYISKVPRDIEVEIK